MKNTNKKGFTLLEILFVVALISIVVAIGLVYMKSSTEAAELAVMKADAREVISEQHLYFAENGEYREIVVAE